MTTPDTERLHFRTWTEDDLPLATSLWGDSNVMTFIGGKLSREQIATKLKSEMSCLQTYGIQYWPLFNKIDGAFIGCCGLKPWAYSGHGSHELGFHLVETAWGKGYASEAAKGVIQFARERKIQSLMAGHHPENLNSKKTLEKLGFEFIEDVFFPPTGLMHPSYRLELA